MKAIMREYGGDHYVIKEVDFGDNNTIVCDGTATNEANIVSIIDFPKDKAKFVRCSNCNEIIPNTPKDIEAHKKAHATHEGCYECRYLRTEKNDSNKPKFTLNEDGTFNRIINDNVRLRCNYYYGINDITSEKRISKCYYNRCATADIIELKTFFSEYPGAFDDMVTVDAIKNFKEIHNEGNYTVLRLKCVGDIYAKANNKGIITSFRFKCRYDHYDVFYSKKYDKLFYNYVGNYKELIRPYNMTTDRFNYIKATIAKLYS